MGLCPKACFSLSGAACPGTSQSPDGEHEYSRVQRKGGKQKPGIGRSAQMENEQERSAGGGKKETEQGKGGGEEGSIGPACNCSGTPAGGSCNSEDECQKDGHNDERNNVGWTKKCLSHESPSRSSEARVTAVGLPGVAR
jgi:hypothetical protein